MNLQLAERGPVIAPVPRSTDVSAALLSRFWEEAEQPAPWAVDQRSAPVKEPAPKRVHYAYD